MTTKNIELIVPPPRPHFVGNGFRVHNFIPGTPHLGMQRMNPFILMDYNSPYVFPPSSQPKGVGVHPHRGFETVTIAYKGQVAHHDSAGNSGVIGEGDVQWMTAGSGILHKEYHEENFSRNGGVFQMVQLWVNLPAKDKLSNPKYQGLTKGELGVFTLPDSQGRVEVIAGSYRGVKGPAYTFSPLHLYNVKLEKGGRADFEFPSLYNTALLVVEGSLRINEQAVAATDHLVLFRNDGETFALEAMEKAVVLVLSGEPIQEPIVAQGPFVMNSRQEILQAIDDFNRGKFGYLED